MSQQSPPDPDQRLNIDHTSIQGSQIGQAGRDLIQGQVVNVTVYDNIDLTNKQTSSTVKPLTKQEYRNRKVLLNKVKKFWIEDVLEESLHVKALIELGLEERLDTIDRPFKTPNETRKILPTGADITQEFDQMGEGRTLLILGDPGAGKTTLLLKLAKNLITRAEENLSQMIPVVFNLSSWASERQSIAEWLVNELSSKYQVSKVLGKSWLENQDLLLLLDGLDEVKAERREACVDALNEFMRTYGQTEIVICSRIKDYEALATRLRLQGAICIQLLTPKQINQYLEQAGEQLAAVKTLLQEDTTLQELAKSPLILSIMSLAYQDASVKELPRTGSVEARRQHLFNAYIKQMFLHEETGKPEEYKPPYSPALTVCWLIWLAQRMLTHSQTIFLIERMQPTWLQTKAQRRLYRLVNGLIGGLIGGLLGGLMSGLLGGLEEEIKTVETLRFSWKKLKSWLMIGGLIGGLMSGLLGGLGFWLIYGLITGLGFGLIAGLYNELFLRLRDAPEMENKTFSNQGIWRSAVNAGIYGLVFALSIGLITGLGFGRIEGIGLIEGLITGLIEGLIKGVTVGLSFGVTVGVTVGGRACLQHFALRLSLYRKGFIPWNYAHFLDYATERIFLQKVGGGYIFIHRLLLEHFAH